MFVKVPDYSEKVGFIHNVARDLELVFETLSPKYLPMVIFIDDLDRCSPTKVAQVIEGVNLFLAGEFPGCIFVMGMDAQMVAAALEVAHKDVVSNLPSYSTDIPIGWRFMDKFVQLPFVIPPSMHNRIKKFSVSLLQEYKLSTTVQTTNSTKRIWQSQDEPVITQSTTQHDQEKIMNEMDQKIKGISNLDAEFLKQVSDAVCDFSNNPRDIKRFMNLFRFYRFVMTNFENPEDVPSFSQLRRWIILSLKWPQVVRWLYYTPSEGGYDNSNQDNVNIPTAQERLKSLEEISHTSGNFIGWKKELGEKIQSL